MQQNGAGGFGKGVELRALQPQECEAFLSLLVPLLRQREDIEPGAKIVVLKKVERCALRIRVDQPSHQHQGSPLRVGSFAASAAPQDSPNTAMYGRAGHALINS